MKNPLNKRFIREFKSDLPKYIVIFTFLLIMVGFVSGFLVAADSMYREHVASFGKRNIENGNFELVMEADEELLSRLEEENVSIYENFYIEEETQDFDSTLRVFKIREGINEVCLMKGELPDEEKEIAIDRVYAYNNEISIGDYIGFGGGDNRNVPGDGSESDSGSSDVYLLKVTGFISLPDYTALYQNTTDMMFDAKKFGVGVVAKEYFEKIESSHLHYVYSFRFHDNPTETETKKELCDDFLETLAEEAPVIGFAPEYSSMAIHSAGDDLGKDRIIVEVFLYMVVAILAFIFAVTCANTIRQESCVIGTLRASGFRRGELVRHYLFVPVCVTLVAALLGNVLGYTIFKQIASDMYYGTYSLPSYDTVWNANAFLKTTVVPVIIMTLVNYIMLSVKLRLSPLKFIRRDISGGKKRKSVRLSPKMSIMSRFGIRIFLQNIPNYLTLICGIFFANTILLLGLALPAMINHNKESIVSNMLATYQYVLAAPAETGNAEAEEYMMTSLSTLEGRLPSESISIYGIVEDSQYVKADFPEDAVLISVAFAQKHRLEPGDEVTLKESYGQKEYTFTVGGIYDYPAALAVFMSQRMYCDVFDAEEEAFTGYFCETPIEDIDDSLIVAKIMKDDFTKLANQMDTSFGQLIHLITAFGVIMFMMIIFLLSKLIIEKNANSISMCKILGYTDSELSFLYILATGVIVVISLIGTIPIADAILGYVCVEMLSYYPGWIPYYVPVDTYFKMFLLGVASYGVIAFLQFLKVKKIPLQVALKNAE